MLSIKRIDVLREIEGTDSNGKRVIFSTAFLTSNVGDYERKQSLLKKATKLRGLKKEILIAEANNIEAGGKLIYHTQCANMRPRGMHAAKLQSGESTSGTGLKQNHYLNRTRNFHLLPGNLPVKAHIDLMVFHNDKKILH